MKQLLLLLVFLWAAICPTAAQHTRTVSLQTALCDSLFLNLQLSCTTGTRPAVVLTQAYLTRRGQLRREAVQCGRLHYEFSGAANCLFEFSTTFTYQHRRYRAQGHYAEPSPGEAPDCALRCVPLRLSDKTLREGEYQDYLR
ncbi:MAG: hypothetical protein IJ533_06640 [Prevotella sp.]|nr:hypothetical protein [Prevotella sp.]